MRFEFATATRVIFGPGVAEETAALVAAYGGNALVVTGSSPQRHASTLEQIRGTGSAVTVFSVGSEPTVSDLRDGTQLARAAGCDVVVAIGGGSALDAGKAISGLVANDGDPLDYLEVIGKGRALANNPAPLIAIPTTAGTGSEVTRNAVVLSEEHALKVSMRSPLLLPTVAVVDPLLTTSMPPNVTASGGLDALTHLVESFLSIKANPLVDPLCIDGVERAARSLENAVRNGDDLAAREDMSMASLLGGLALANAGLGAVHGFAGVLGGRYGMPHGLVCGRLLPFVFEANLAALRDRLPDSPHLARFDVIAATVTGDNAATAADAVEWFHALAEAVSVPAFSAFGLDAGSLPAVVADAMGASSMRGNPVPLTEDELIGILAKAI